MEIERVDSYKDTRFSEKVLYQHGAFLVDGKYPCEVEILNSNTAVIDYYDSSVYHLIIERFRFYAEHITRFLDKKGNLIKEFPAVSLFQIKLQEIQPSQFYIDIEKIDAVQKFIIQPEDIIIPVFPYQGKYISLDGHTRLFVAKQKKFSYVQAFFADSGDYLSSIFAFVEEAQKRGIFLVGDMKAVSHKDYKVLWYGFCDTFFQKQDIK